MEIVKLGCTLAVLLVCLSSASFAALTDNGAALTGVYRCTAAWGDYDNDGDLDLALSGIAYDATKTRICRNDGNFGFLEMNYGIPGAQDCSLAWGDFDKDGDPDLAIAGDFGGSVGTRVFRNNSASSFTEVTTSIPGVKNGCVAWADCDSDRLLDLAVTGNSGGAGYAKVYRYNGSSFSAMSSTFTAMQHSSLSWGDYDNNGTYDLVVGGMVSVSPISSLTNVYKNSAGIFSNSGIALDGIMNCSLQWGDYDADGDLDLLACGLNNTPLPQSKIYANSGVGTNTAPAAPTGLWVKYSTIDDFTLCWDQASDTESGTTRITYNLRAGTTSGAQDVACAMADLSTGQRRIPAMGNAGTGYSRMLRRPWGRYYWAVQTVDSGYMGGPWSAEHDMSFVGTEPWYWSFQYYDGAMTWADYDTDGKLDLIVSGYNGTNTYIELYRNLGYRMFQDMDISSTGGLPEMKDCAMAWGDYDNDGDPDLAIAGSRWGSTWMAKIYRNNGNGTFTDINAGLPDIVDCSLAWGDYDNDGDVDLAIAGYSAVSAYITRIYRNNSGGSFTDIAAGMTGVRNGCLAWADYDLDQDLDLAVAGQGQSGRVAKVYRNYGGSLGVGQNMTGVSNGSICWGDYDNNGYLDLAVAGYNGTDNINKIFKNMGGTLMGAGSPGMGSTSRCSTGWADYDSDGDLDLMVMGQGNNALLYHNWCDTANAPPSAPTGLTSSFRGGVAHLAWNPASDDRTDSPALSYNLRVGTSPGASNIMSGLANGSGTRYIPAVGNAGTNTSWTLKNLPPATYYWSVQAIDASMLGSAWATEQHFEPDTSPPTIHSVTVVPAIALARDPLRVVVSASDNREVTQVLVNGSDATLEEPVWVGQISADPMFGQHTVSVQAFDEAGNYSADTSGAYTTTDRVYALTNRSASDAAAEAAASRWQFKVWGRASDRDAESFTLNDGSGVPTRVTAPGHTVQNGDYVVARGALVTSGGATTLLTVANLVSRAD